MISRESRRIGNMCRRFRQDELKISQKEMGYYCGYSKENISSFECGRNDNYHILLAYMSLGLLESISLNDLIRIDKNEMAGYRAFIATRI